MQTINYNMGTSGLIFIFIILLILLLQFRERKFRLWRAILSLGFMLLITIPFIYLEIQMTFTNNLLLFGAGMVGLLLGMAIAHHIKIKIADDGSLLLRGSFLSVGIWALIILAKFYGQDTLNQWGFDPNLLLSLFLVMTVASMISRNFYVYQRYLKKKSEIDGFGDGEAKQV